MSVGAAWKPERSALTGSALALPFHLSRLDDISVTVVVAAGQIVCSLSLSLQPRFSFLPSQSVGRHPSPGSRLVSLIEVFCLILCNSSDDWYDQLDE